jgi:N-6 DNA Methylase
MHVASDARFGFIDTSTENKLPVTLGQIADLAGVGPSAVSNWRKRFDDFPRPVASATDGRDLFSLPAVEEWLLANGRLGPAFESERVLWQAVDILRGYLDARGIVEVLCAALAYVYVSDRRSAGAEDPRRLRHSPAEVFAPLERIEPAPRERLVALVGKLHRDAIPSLIEEALALHPRFVETRTSQRLIELLVRLGLGGTTAAACERIFDPAAGQGGLLLAAAKAAPPGVELAGQEINGAAWRIAMQRLLVEGHSAALARGDSLLDDADPGLRADLVLCDPPYGLQVSFPSRPPTDSRWAFGLPGTGAADYAWLQHAIHHLSPAGRGYVLLPAGTLSRGGRDAKTRAQLVRRGAVEAVVALPSRVAEHTATPLALWILRAPSDTGKAARVLLVDATGGGEKSGEPLDEGLIERIAQVVEHWRARAEVRDADRGFAAAVPVPELLGPHTSLRPARWVRQASEIDVAQRRRDLRSAIDATDAARLRLLTEGKMDSSRLRGNPRALAWVSVRDLLAEGRADVVRGIRVRPDDIRPSGTPILRAQDVPPDSRQPTEHVDPETLPRSCQLTRPGDLAVAFVGGRLHAAVERHGGRVPALPVQVLRLEEDWLDPALAAAFLASPSNRHLAAAASSGRAHLDLRELQLPAIPRERTAALREALSALTTTETLARELLAASDRARDALLDLGGHAVADEPADVHEEPRPR